MVTNKEKQLAIILLKERLERVTGKKVILKEGTVSGGLEFPIGTFSNQVATPVKFTKFENNVTLGHVKPRNDGSYSVTVFTDVKWGNDPFTINAYMSKDGNTIMQVWFMPMGCENYVKQESIKDYSPLLQYIKANNKPVAGATGQPAQPAQ